MSTITANQADFVPASDVTAPPVPTMSEAQVAAQAALDQVRAAERTKLVKRLSGIVSAGASRTSIEWCKDAVSYAVSGSPHVTKQKAMILDMYSDAIEDDDCIVGKSSDTSREFNEMFKLYGLYTHLPLVAKCDKFCVQQMMRFVDSWNFSGKAEIKAPAKAMEIVTNLVTKKGYRTTSGAIDRAGLKKAIDEVLGKRSSPNKVSDNVGSEKEDGQTEGTTETKEPTTIPFTADLVIAWLHGASAEDRLKVASQVVNIDVVAAFLTDATADDLLGVAGKLSEKRQVELCDALTPVNV